MSCPICAKASDPKYRPFCSRRCADVDLAHWMRGDYALPADAAEDETPADLPPGPPGLAPRPQ
ncbi:DNA gyrase inhibitor YacG [Tabrizicola oligotrophica]|uniref:DNA gyrase inhibitor YacG n=1 Tax=Tabrizicola oligotrophica TaxID=2710650 RepID=A0A6M0QWT2_9RHOB|nr:DNA gyrase inhibitor YacG [Tabrizicola oligotrophica]NEY91910.1 DNA gyrase inhibitor YacG [Tabrizicola oligotrophica]